MKSTGVFRYRVKSKPDSWLVMIAPGCDIAEATHALLAHFQKGQLLEVKKHG